MDASVSYATCCWEKDWRQILLDPDYLRRFQIENHCYSFKEKLLIINNVECLEEVRGAAERRVRDGTLTRYVVAKEIPPIFQLGRDDLNLWQYYNALGPLTAIYEASGEFLLYQTGDVFLKKPVKWIAQTIRFLEKNEEVKVANLIWNDRKDEARRESYRRTWNFFIAKEGFSDQMFFVRTQDFKAPIYGEIREDSHHYPRGDVFEKRVFSYLKNRGWERITFMRGSYTHENL